MAEIANALQDIATALVLLLCVIAFKSFGTKVTTIPWNLDYQRRLVEALEKLAKAKERI